MRFDPDLESLDFSYEEAHRVEIQDDLDVVRKAILHVPEDQRAVLIAVTVEGGKPSHLEQALGRPASSIYSLLHRAKKSLIRSVLRVLLEDKATGACKAAAAKLPAIVPDTLDCLPQTTRNQHYRDCARCKAVWQRFAEMSMLGVVPLLVVAQVVGAPPSAAVAESLASTGGDASRNAPQGSSAYESDAVSTDLANGESHDSVFSRSDLGAGTDQARLSWLLSIAQSRGYIAIAIGALILGGLITAITLVFVATESLQSARPPVPTLVVGEVPDSKGLGLDIQFNVPESQWSVELLEVEFGFTVSGAIAPPGWDCEPGGMVARCVAATHSPKGGVFRFQGLTSGPQKYKVKLEATTHSNYHILGTASGQLGAGGSK